MPVWDDVIPEAERWAYAGDFAKTGTRGARPALLVIDVRLTFAHESPDPLSIAIDRWLSYWGEAYWRAIEHL